MIADFVRKLIDAGCAPAVAAEVVSEAFAAGVSAGNPMDKRVQRIREYDREYKRKKRMSNGIPFGPMDGAYIEESLTKKESIVRRAQRIPVDWSLSAANREWAIKEGVPVGHIESQAAKFKDWWIAKAGKDGAKLDWDATWRNWCRSFLERGGSTQKLPPSEKWREAII